MARLDDDLARGGGGDDVLIGGVGADILTGGAGNDVYGIDSTLDSVFENATEGIDTVQSTVSYILGANVENLALMGNEALNEGIDTVTSYLDYSLTAHVENLELAGGASVGGTGNALDNTLIGNSGNNLLLGGLGADTLIGGDGDDVLDGATLAVSLSTIVYVTGPGTARYIADGGPATAFAFTDGVVPGVSAGQSLTLQDGGKPVKVYVTPGSRMDARGLVTAGDSIYLSGKFADYSQAIDQESGVYTFTRIAGLPAGQSESAMVTVSNADVRLYFSDGGIGLNAFTDVRLMDLNTYLFQAIEQGWLTGGAQAWPGSVALLMTEGADRLRGGLGNDIYFVDEAGDVVVENAGEGSDTVRSSINYTLGAHVENLTLTGSAALSGTGNALNNTLNGNVGSNVLTGGAGSDTYAAYRGMGRDRIVENDATAGNTDVLSFGSGIAANQLWFSRTGNDLEVSIVGTADRFTVQDWYSGSQYHVEQIKAGDGKVLLDSRVDALVQAMAGFAPPAMGQTSLAASQQTALAPVLAANWQ